MSVPAWPCAYDMRRSGYDQSSHIVHLDDLSAQDVSVEDLKLKLLALFRSPTYRPPMLPAVALELLALSRKQRVTSAEVADLLGRDPMLAGQVLRVAKSAVYTRGEPVRSLDQAIVRLGLDKVTDLFFQAALEMKVFRAPGFESEMEALRQHSAFTAECARLVSRHTLGFEDYAFLCGLLHDVGIAACILSLNEIAGPTRKVSFENAWPSVRDIHASCSELLANIWQLPPDIALVLRLHHTLAHQGQVHPLAAAVAVADGLAQENGFGFREETQIVDTESAAAFAGIGRPALAQLRQAVALMAQNFGQPTTR